MWPWRDWVINAFNADQSYDLFIQDQLAGDLLPNATLAQRVATGFHRNTQINEEGGIDPEQFRIASYEMAFQMQTIAPEAIDLRGETDATLALYGADRPEPSFARNCLLT